MRVFVTGASGFIGRRVTEHLITRGHIVHALYRTPPGDFEIPEKLVAFKGDLLDLTSVERAMSGCDQVFHVGGYAKNWSRNPGNFFRVNSQGTGIVMRSASELNVQKIVYTSSAMTIGPSNRVSLNENSIRATPLLTDYEASKLEAERLVMSYVERGLDAVIVNPTRVFGPGLLTEGNSLTRMFKFYLEGKWHFIPGNGEALGNYAFVDDVARGHIQAMDRGRSGERYILGGENTSYNHLFELLAIIIGCKHWLVHVPGKVAIAASYVEECRARLFQGYPSITPGWSRTFLQSSAYTCSKAERDLGYQITPLHTALQQTIAWLKRTNHLTRRSSMEQMR